MGENSCLGVQAAPRYSGRIRLTRPCPASPRGDPFATAGRPLASPGLFSLVPLFFIPPHALSVRQKLWERNCAGLPRRLRCRERQEGQRGRLRLL